MGVFPGYTWERFLQFPEAEAALLPRHLGVEKRMEGMCYSFCIFLGKPHSQSSSPHMKYTFLLSVLDLPLTSRSKFLQLYTPSSSKVQRLREQVGQGGAPVSAYWLREFSQGALVGPPLGTPEVSTIIFTATHPAPTTLLLTVASQQWLSWVRTHTSTPSHSLAPSFPATISAVAIFSWSTVLRARHILQALTRPPTHARNLMLWPWARP